MVTDLPSETKKLKKVLVITRRDSFVIGSILIEEGFKMVKKNPDFIICYGGDGTVLFSERKFPEIPKLIIKTSKPCRIYDYSLVDLKKYLSRIKLGDFHIYKEMKLETITKGKKLVGLNEIQIHLKLPIYAVRFSLQVNGKTYEDLIGDGVIFATPFGSTAYYKATGGKSFKKGIGISFNNLHNKPVTSCVASEDSVIKLNITRGPAWLLADNNEDFIELLADDSINIQKSESVANFIYFTLK